MLENIEGKFLISENQPFQNAGMITDALFKDYNGDGSLDLILVGEWMSPKFYSNEAGNFVEDNLNIDELKGLWQQIQPYDIDQDGDTDYLLGNWGTNSKFRASTQHPLKMYYADFDNNGSTETIICNYKNGKYYPILGLDELAGQIISLRKRFNDYKSFAGKSIQEIFSKEILKEASVMELTTLASGYLRHDGNNKFEFIPFKNELQVSPLTSFLCYDFDGNGKDEVLVAGNYFGVQPFQGRFDSFPGAIIYSENQISLGNVLGLDLTQMAVRHLNIITLDTTSYLLVTINDDDAQVYKIMN